MGSHYPCRSKILEYLELRGGEFFWRKTYTNAVSVGDRAGCVKSDTGHIIIGIFGKTYRAHKLVWLVTHNEEPPEIIDHINRNPQDNRPDNLRAATTSQNAMNANKRGHNTSGYKGVSRHHDGRWRAQMRFQNKRYHLGLFSTPEEASKAYLKAAEKVCGEYAHGG